MVQIMMAALQTLHMTLGDEIIVNQLLECQRQLNADLAVAAVVDGDGITTPPIKISILALIVKAVSLALLEYPLVNSMVHDMDQCVVWICHHQHMGIAMDMAWGLMVPVVRHCEQLTGPCWDTSTLPWCTI